MRAAADNAGRIEEAGRWAAANVPFGVIGVLFRARPAASSAGSVSFSFIHSNDMPFSATFRFPLWQEML
jgi:hypothetical protein